MLLDAGRLQDGEPYLAGTAKTAVARLSAATAEEIGADGKVTVATAHGEITLPLEITDMPDRVVWLPANSPGSAVYRDLGVQAGGRREDPERERRMSATHVLGRRWPPRRVPRSATASRTAWARSAATRGG